MVPDQVGDDLLWFLHIRGDVPRLNRGFAVLHRNERREGRVT